MKETLQKIRAFSLAALELLLLPEKMADFALSISRKDKRRDHTKNTLLALAAGKRLAPPDIFTAVEELCELRRNTPALINLNWIILQELKDRVKVDATRPGWYGDNHNASRAAARLEALEERRGRAGFLLQSPIRFLRNASETVTAYLAAHPCQDLEASSCLVLNSLYHIGIVEDKLRHEGKKEYHDILWSVLGDIVKRQPQVEHSTAYNEGMGTLWNTQNSDQKKLTERYIAGLRPASAVRSVGSKPHSLLR